MYLINMLKEELAKKVEFGNTLVYSSFLHLYEPYKKLLPETIFASEVMNIAPSNFHTLKFGGTCTIVPFFDFDNETIEIIRSQMEKQFHNSSIDYKTFKTIYDDYQHLVKEQDFAKIIFNINNSFFHKFKQGLFNARVFKNEDNLFMIHYERLYNLLYPIYNGSKTNYQQFLKIHQQYASFLSESDFAVCLGLNFGTYSSIKKRKRKDGSGVETVLFYNEKIDYSQINITELQIYRNKKINYYQFKEIYLKYGKSLKEDEFARILGIPFNTFDNFKRKKNTNLIILKKALSPNEKNKILLECRKKGLTRRPITYLEFVKYYEPYQDYVSPTDFAYIIGIKQRSISSLKKGSRVLALDFDFNKQISNMIKQELMEYHGEFISYQEFLRLHSIYNNYVSKTEFCYILGISLSEYYNIKNHETEVTAIDFFKVERNIIKYQLSENKMYLLEDFQKLAKMTELDIEDIIKLYFGENKSDVVKKYMIALEKNKQLYFGNIPLKDTTLSNEILNFCKNYSKAVCIKLGCQKYIEDIASQAILYVIENCGSYEINFGKDWWNFYKPYLVGIMKVWCKIKKTEFLLSLDAPVDNSSKVRTRYNFISSSSNDYLEIEELFDKGDDIYTQIISAIECGFEMNEIMNILSDRLGMKQEDILNMIKNQMFQQDLVKQSANGKIQLARKY